MLSRLLATLFPALYCRWYNRRSIDELGYHYEPGHPDGKGPLHDAWLLALSRINRAHLPQADSD